MSWFDATGFAHLAKTALKEAQKTIDKALDIQEQQQQANATTSSKTKKSPVLQVEDDKFFSSWGLGTSMPNKSKDTKVSTDVNIKMKPPIEEISQSSSKLDKNVSSSLWGSFTGSFFEPAKDSDITTVHSQPRKGSNFMEVDEKEIMDLDEPADTSITDKEDSLCDDTVELVGFEQSQLIVGMGNTDEDEEVVPKLLLDEGGIAAGLSLDQLQVAPNLFSPQSDPGTLEVRSSSSIEVIAFSSPDSETFFTTTIGDAQHSSRSAGSCESVEVLPDSLTSPVMEDIRTKEDIEITEVTEQCISLREELQASFPDDSGESYNSSISSCQTMMAVLSDTPRSQIASLSETETTTDTTELESSSDTVTQSEKEAEHSNDPSPMPNELVESSDGENVTTVVEVMESTESLLADAMSESVVVHKEVIKEQQQETEGTDNRENSPSSSESRSDLVKLESGHASGHTSGDEVETATSSDIEIISPNGDSSSTQSRHSPSKPFRVQRILPGGSFSIRSDRSDSGSERSVPSRRTASDVRQFHDMLMNIDTSSDCDRHSKQLSHLTTLLQARETQLIELSRRNVETEDHNSQLQSQICELTESRNTESHKLGHMSQEFTTRLESMERRLQQTVRERDSLVEQLKEMQERAILNSSKTDLTQELIETKEEVKELRSEGEKLAKQLGNKSAALKKARAKEKEAIDTMERVRDDLENQMQETEWLKKSLAAKEDVERKQIEAIRLLQEEKNLKEAESLSLVSSIAQYQDELDNKQIALEKTQKEMEDMVQAQLAKDEAAHELALSAEISAREEIRQRLEEEREENKREREAMSRRVDQLREALKGGEQEYSRREGKLRHEILELQSRLVENEHHKEELAQGISQATRPLLRQLEVIQDTLASQQAQWERQERETHNQLLDAQSHLTASIAKERSATEQLMTFQSRFSSLESQIVTLRVDATKHLTDIEQMKEKLRLSQDKRQKDNVQLETLRRSFAEEMALLQREMETLENQLTVERAAVEAENRKCLRLQEQLGDKDSYCSIVPVTPIQDRGSVNSSPTPSLQRLSVSGSTAESVVSNWGADDSFDRSGMVTPRLTLYDSMRLSLGGSTSLLEGLQAQLKMREGEVSHLQSEISGLERTREELGQELSHSTAQVEELQMQVDAALLVKQKCEETEQKYNALLQMYGEKLEENEELKLDLGDVKEMYRAQIEQLLQSDINS